MKVRILREPSNLRRRYVIYPSNGSDPRTITVYKGYTTEIHTGVEPNGRQAHQIIDELVRERRWILTDGGPWASTISVDQYELAELSETGDDRKAARLLRNGQPNSDVLPGTFLRLGLDIPGPNDGRIWRVDDTRGNWVYLREQDPAGIDRLINQRLTELARDLQRQGPDATGGFDWLHVLRQLEGYPAADVRDAFGPFAGAAVRSYRRYLEDLALESESSESENTGPLESRPFAASEDGQLYPLPKRPAQLRVNPPRTRRIDLDEES